MNGNVLYTSAIEDDVVLDQAHYELLHTEIPNGNVSIASTNSPAPISGRRKMKSQRKLGKLLRTAALCAAYFALGLCMSVTGPTLPHLQVQVGASVGKIAYIFTARSIGVLAGSLAGGVLFDRYNRYSLLFMIILCMGIGIGSMPWCSRLWLLMGSSAMVGIGGGFLDTGASVLCLELWGKESGPYMQALHFFFGVGGFVAPLLAQPFLSTVAISHETNITKRFVRSAVEIPPSFNETNIEDDANITANAIVKAIETYNLTAEQNTSAVFLISSTTEPISPTIQSINATLNSSVALNTTGSYETTTNESSGDSTTTKSPKPKPKPSVIDGSLLGKSEIWDKIPLPQVPAAAEEKPPPPTTIPTETLQSGNTSVTSNITNGGISGESNLNQTLPSGNISMLPGTSGGLPIEANSTETGQAGTLSTISSTTSGPSFNRSNSIETISVSSLNTDENTGSTTAINSTEVDETENSTTLDPAVISATSGDSVSPNPSAEPAASPATVPVPVDISAIPASATTAPPLTQNLTNSEYIFGVSESSIATKTTSGSTEEMLKPEEIEKSSETGNVSNNTGNGDYSHAVPGKEEFVPIPPQIEINQSTTSLSSTSTEGSLLKSQSEGDIVETTSATEFATKSRGKSRGQQEEVTEESTTSKGSLPNRHNKPSTSTNGSEDEYRPGATINLDWEKYGVTRIHLLYSIIAIIVIHISFSFLFFLCTSERDRTSAAVAASRGPSGIKPVRKNIIVALLCLVFLIYVGMEVSYSQYLTTFGMQSKLQLPEENANYITAIFWGSFALTRLAAIFLASFMNPSHMLFGNFFVSLVGSLMLCIWGQSNQLVLSIGSAIIGIGMASTFAAVFVWTEKRLAVASRIASAFCVASALGEMITPALTGALLEHDVMTLMYYTFASNLACVALLVGAWSLSKTRRGSTESIFPGNDYQLARQGEEEHELN